ncbi:MAG: YIP1 family protein [Clostridia bacterium]|nr:YIP1 family protein [Clostridia bacterium]
MKKFISALSLLFVLLMVVSIPVGAAEAYQTYTYSIDGNALYSPDAYEAHVTLSTEKMGLTTALNSAKDIVTDASGNVYIADTGNSRILVFDKYYNFQQEIKDFRNDQQIKDYFSKPQGIFVTEDRYVEGELKPGKIYVCDTEASRIVTFVKKDGVWSFNSIIGAPESSLFDEDAIYWPVALAVDAHDRLFVVSSETKEGIIVMTDQGDFTGFIGAQQSAGSVWSQIWSRFQSQEQRDAAIQVISYPYNNIAINKDGLIYATIYATELEGQMESAVLEASTAGTYAPCKLLNPSGAEIMRRNGFWPPAGEIDLRNMQIKAYDGVSIIKDVACGPEQTWTIVDTKRNKLYTYDYDGNLLFAFGDSGTQLGNMNNIQSIVYQGDKLIVLFGGTVQNITVFKRTEYGDILIQALRHQNERQYDLAVEDWKEILMRNSNYDAAYVGIGEALFRTGDYEEALEYYKTAYDIENYSEAYKELRKEWMARFFVLIPIIIVVLFVLIVKGLGRAGKINARVAVSGKKPTFKEELVYVFHIMFHPFDGFYDLKHEKRGSVRAALTFMVLAVVALFYRSVGSGYVMNPRGKYSTIFMQFLVIFVPVLLFAVANWCLTTLFDGEGSFKDIFIAIGYSVLPIPLTVIPTTLMSNFMVSSEINVLTLFTTLGFIWTGFLIFFGMMVTHDYTMSKNLVTTLGTIVGMVFIMFLGILFTSLVMDIMTFVTDITSEINYRL